MTQENNEKPMELTEEQKAFSLSCDADAVMEQIIMQHSRHMQMSALVEHQLMYPDMTIREFFEMARQELDDQDEELDEDDDDEVALEDHLNRKAGIYPIDLSLEENAENDV
tara:strand:- start:1495 stop:1827 length:333 start_codon:yes stop_codon:yes gene_type:complete